MPPPFRFIAVLLFMHSRSGYRPYSDSKRISKDNYMHEKACSLLGNGEGRGAARRA